MSDIDIQFPWWADVLILLIYAFWPLTVAAAAAVVWLCLARTSRAARIAVVVIGVPWLVSAGSILWFRIDDARSDATSAAYDRAHVRTLATDAVVAGMDLPAGTVVRTDERFRLSSLDLAKPAVLFGIPLKGTVMLRDGRLDGSQAMQRDATIDGLPCSAGSTVSFSNGRLGNCLLSRPTTIGGVPCRGYVDIGGTFVGCGLAAPYARYGATWYEGTDVRGDDGYRTFTVGSRAPSLRVYGSTLTQGSSVVYRKGSIELITPSAPLHYRGCAFAQIERRDGVMTGEADGTCSLPALTNGRIRLPNL